MTRSMSRLEASAYFANNVEKLPYMTLRQHAERLGVTTSKMRNAILDARPLLARKGIVITVPTYEDGYLRHITRDRKEMIIRQLHRLGPIVTELERMQADDLVLSGGEASVYQDLMDGFYASIENIGLILDDYGEGGVAQTA